jgi:potassium-transporting ATPase KdpC subunit
MFMTHLRPAITLTVAFTLLTGLAYPFAMTGVAQGLFPAAANGSLILRDGEPVGSDLIGQAFTAPGYLHPRPSVSGYNAAGTGASNLGPTSAALIADVVAREAAYMAENGTFGPIDAVTASGSGLDPHISPENAAFQAQRIAAARGVDTGRVQAVIEQATEGRFLAIYGEARVNVLRVNLALDAAFPTR